MKTMANFDRCASERSAELHSAVSPIFNRQGVQNAKSPVFSPVAEFNSAIRQIKNLRYALASAFQTLPTSA
jgi:hypothetical protein